MVGWIRCGELSEVFSSLGVVCRIGWDRYPGQVVDPARQDIAGTLARFHSDPGVVLSLLHASLDLRSPDPPGFCSERLPEATRVSLTLMNLQRSPGTGHSVLLYGHTGGTSPDMETLPVGASQVNCAVDSPEAPALDSPSRGQCQVTEIVASSTREIVG